MKVDTGASQSHLVAGGDRSESVTERTSNGETKVTSSGANGVPVESQAVPVKNPLREGPDIDAKGAFRKATYVQVVRHDSNSDGTRITRQDR